MLSCKMLQNSVRIKFDHLDHDKAQMMGNFNITHVLENDIISFRGKVQLIFSLLEK